MSFGCNLGQPIERAKIEELTGTITTRFKVRPSVFKAGRYGLGTSTVNILESLGYDVDTSVIPHMDFRAESGPNFLGFSPRPAIFGNARRMLELPCTTGFTGPPGAWARACTAWPRRRRWSPEGGRNPVKVWSPQPRDALA
jgi:hypothetical protein